MNHVAHFSRAWALDEEVQRADPVPASLSGRVEGPSQIWSGPS